MGFACCCVVQTRMIASSVFVVLRSLMHLLMHLLYAPHVWQLDAPTDAPTVRAARVAACRDGDGHRLDRRAGQHPAGGGADTPGVTDGARVSFVLGLAVAAVRGEYLYSLPN